MNRINTDLHTHIIPDVDDGSPDMESSLCLIREIIRQGIHRIFATSHAFAFIDKVESKKTQKAFLALKEAAARENLPVDLFLGCEMLCMKRWMKRLILGLKEGQYPSLNGTKYVLIEFTTFHIDSEEVFYCIDRLLDAGYYPVLAHAERYYHNFADLNFIERIKEKGCLIQLSFNSLYEEKDPSIKNFARELIDLELADFMGSDSHNMNHRPPEIINGRSYLEQVCSEEYLQKLLDTNTKKYLIGE